MKKRNKAFKEKSNKEIKSKACTTLSYGDSQMNLSLVYS
jgi:hypothetical protein